MCLQSCQVKLQQIAPEQCICCAKGKQYYKLCKAFSDSPLQYLREDAGCGVVCLYDDMLIELSGVHAQ